MEEEKGMMENIKETAHDIVSMLAPFNEDDADERDSERFAVSFKMVLEAAQKWHAEHGDDERANISVRWDENGEPVVTVTPMEGTEE